MNYERPWDARLAYYLIYPLRDSRITPNHLTCLRLMFGVLAAIALASGNYFWSNIGAICFVISNFLDHTDGEFARLTGKLSKQGHYFDLVSDAMVNIILFMGIGTGLMHSNLGGWALPMGIIAGFSVAAIFHIRHQIEQSVGKTQARQPNYGGFEAEDVLYLLIIVTTMEWLTPFLILASVGAPLFSLWVWREYSSLNNKTA